MCTNNWPLLLDLTRDECKRILRQLELEAYSAVLTAFRAQGDLSRDKKNILQDLQNVLSISTERHRAEVRRAANDEKLTTIADNMAGPDVSSEWQIEGRRLIPLMPRLVPQTAFTVAANNAANMQAEKNLTMPSPGYTGSKDAVLTSSAPTTPSSMATTPGVPKSSRPTSPASNVVVLPSGMSIHIKGGVNTDDEDIHVKKRRRSSSTEGLIVSKAPTQISSVPMTKVTSSVAGTAGSSVGGMSPMKITFTKSPAKAQTTTVTPSQKVILVSTTSHAGHTPAIIHKPLSVPVMKTATTTGGTVTTFTSPRASIIMPASMASSVANGNLGNIITVATSGGTGTTISSAVTSLTSSTPTILATSLNAARPRTKMITTRPKLPQVGTKSGLVMQMGAPVQPSPQGLHNIQVKPMHSKPSIHIKHEGGMKIITQGVPTTSKILPKPPGGATGSPMVVMSSAQPSITMVAKTASSIAGQVAGGRVLNITTQGGKVIASTTRGTTANVVTVNPKTLQLTAIKGAGGTTVLTTSGRVATATGAKPNVIVVQKAQPKRSQTPTTASITLPRTPPTSTTNSPFEKELVSFIQKQDSLKHIVTTQQKPTTSKQVVTCKTGVEGQPKRQPQPIAVKVRSDLGEAGRSSLLAELIQAVGIQPDGSGEAATSVTSSSQESSAIQTVVVQRDNLSVGTPTSLVAIPTSQTEVVTAGKDIRSNRWVEYDIPRSQHTLSTVRDSSDTSAIKALLDLQTGARKPTVLEQQQPQQQPVQQQMPQVHRVANVDLGQLSHMGLQQSEVYTLDSAGHLQQASSSTAAGTSDNLQYVTTSTDIRGRQDLQVVEGTTNVVLEQAGGGTVAVQLAGADLARLSTMGHEIMGELDPETGIFYTTSTGTAESAEIPTVKPSPAPIETLVKEGVDSMAPVGKPIDFLSSALTQAQIDLDPYQFIEEDEPAFTTKLPPSATETSHHVSNQANQTLANQTLERQTLSNQTLGNQTLGSQTLGNQTLGNQTLGNHTLGNQTLGSQTLGSQPLVSMLTPAPSSATHTVPLTQRAHTQGQSQAVEDNRLTLIEAGSSTTPVSALPIITEKASTQPQMTTVVKIQKGKVIVENPQPEVTSTTSPSPAGVVVEELLEEMVVQDGIITIDQHEEVCVADTASNVTVAVEPGGLDTTTMVIEDFASQQFIGDHGDQSNRGDQIAAVELGQENHASGEPGSSSYHDMDDLTPGCLTETSPSSAEGLSVISDHHSTEGDGSLSSPVRASQRKRRPPSMPDDSPPQGNMSGWVRHAAGLLQKVCKFRGSRKEKGELNASAWFLAPVDPKEVPDYYDIIKQPMDFGTVRHKLEASQYEGWDDYHTDMMRVRANCQQYNPPGHEVRKDCDEVFAFYLDEYERTLDKWQKQHVGSPSSKKQRVDRSPVRT